MWKLNIYKHMPPLLLLLFIKMYKDTNNSKWYWHMTKVRYYSKIQTSLLTIIVFYTITKYFQIILLHPRYYTLFLVTAISTFVYKFHWKYISLIWSVYHPLFPIASAILRLWGKIGGGGMKHFEQFSISSITYASETNVSLGILQFYL